jgi:hypothetical protein
MIILFNISLVPSEEMKKEFADLCIPLLLQTLNTLYSSSFKDISPADGNYYYYCFGNLQHLNFSPIFGKFYTSIFEEIVKSGSFSKTVDIFSLHVKNIKNNKNGLSMNLLNGSVGVLFNISIEGCIEEKSKFNTRKLIFDNKTEEILIEMHKLLSSSKITTSSFEDDDDDDNNNNNNNDGNDDDNDDEKDIIISISIILINIHKGEICPPSLLPHLSVVHEMMLQPKKDSGVEWRKWSKIGFEGITNGTNSLNEYRKEVSK